VWFFCLAWGITIALEKKLAWKVGAALISSLVLEERFAL